MIEGFGALPVVPPKYVAATLRRGFRAWLVTDEGHAEIERTDTWKNWKF
ncbi:hypothetical protein [Rhizobium sp. 007]|nr:hypothetical protein [Rhizobium sp. 007]QPB21749.1 hypothetical protein ISN39_10135 [Rhizobium sp. 007]